MHLVKNTRQETNLLHLEVRYKSMQFCFNFQKFNFVTVGRPALKHDILLPIDDVIF